MRLSIRLSSGSSLPFETGAQTRLSELLEQLQLELNEVAFLCQDIDSSPQLLLNFDNVAPGDLSKTLVELGLRDNDVIRAECIDANDLQCADNGGLF